MYPNWPVVWFQWCTECFNQFLNSWCKYTFSLDILSLMFWAFRDHFVNAPSQWETMLHCNVISHWLDAFTKNDPWYCTRYVILYQMCYFTGGKQTTLLNRKIFQAGWLFKLCLPVFYGFRILHNVWNTIGYKWLKLLPKFSIFIYIYT